MLNKLIKPLLLSGFILFSLPSFALSKLGHQVVCQLAFNHLTPTKQQQITRQLHAVPKTQQKLINQYNRLDKNTPLTFATACTWADAIKGQDQFSQYKSWHYLNVPRDLVRITKPMCSKNCLPQAIITHQRKLKSSPRSWESAQALLFVGHWLGDIHQPLHISYASDLGGNKVLFTSRRECKNLHSYWDTCLIKTAGRTKEQWVRVLGSRWNELSVSAFYSQQVWQWADESYQMIRKPSFKYCELTSRQECLQPKGKITITNSYPRKYQPIMEKQLLIAAKRLTRLLETTL